MSASIDQRKQYATTHHCIRTRRCARAFTLVELLFVLIIMAMLAGVATPRYFRTITNQRIAAVQRKIQTDLAYAQRRARLRSTQQKVKFDVSKNTYTLATVPDLDRPGQEFEVRLNEDPYNATIVSADFGGSTDLIYDAYGVPTSSGTIVIRVDDQELTITVDNGSGLGIIVISRKAVVVE